MTSEVSQLSEMNAVLISSKEENEKRRQEAAQKAAKIAELEKQLEEQVAFADRYRLMKISATERSRKRAEKLHDLFVKLDHVVKQTSDVHVSRVAVTAEGIQVHEAVASQRMPGVSAILEKLTSAENRHFEAISSKVQQEVKAARFPAENRSKENQLKELADKAEELQARCRTHDQDELIADVARCASLKAMEVLRLELASLQQRIEAAESTFEQNTLNINNIRTSTAAAECDWNGEMAIMISQRELTNTDTQALAQRITELRNDTTRQEQLSALQTKREMLTQVAQTLLMEMEEIKLECRQDDPEVVEMKAHLHENNQRLDLLKDQLEAGTRAIAAHSINEPDFVDRKEELQRLSAKIAALRLAQANVETRKAALEEDVYITTERAESAMKAATEEIQSLQQESTRAITERKEAAAALIPIQLTATRLQEELATLQGNSRETKTDLEQVLSLEKQCQDQLTATDSDDDRAFRQYGKTILEQQAETESIERKIEECKRDHETAVMSAKRQEEDRLEKEKLNLFTELVTRKTAAMMAEIEAASADEVKQIQQEVQHKETSGDSRHIISEDARLRVACTEANQGTASGDECLKTAMMSEVTSLEARAQRLKENAEGQTYRVSA